VLSHLFASLVVLPSSQPKLCYSLRHQFSTSWANMQTFFDRSMSVFLESINVERREPWSTDLSQRVLHGSIIPARKLSEGQF
jgi:hypothetical protein